MRGQTRGMRERRPRLRALTGEEARRSLANRLTRPADAARNIATRLGAHPYRIFMVWQWWDAKFEDRQTDRGEGDVHTLREIELLPCPKVESLDGVSFSIFHAGTIPAGSVRLTGVSNRYSYDELTGKMIPEHHEDQIPDPFEFFYELREDGRGDPMPVRMKFRLLSVPTRDAENAQWTVMLERTSEDRNRDGSSAYLTGKQG